MDQKHILSIYVKNQAGVMSQVSGLFTRRGFNIDSVAVGITDKPEISVITIILKGSDEDLFQFKQQMLKLPDVVSTRELPYHDSIVKELLLIRVKASPEDREEIFGIVEVFGGTIDEVTEKSMLVEVSGNNRQITSTIFMLKKFGILEIARTGQVALAYETYEDSL